MLHYSEKFSMNRAKSNSVAAIIAMGAVHGDPRSLRGASGGTPNCF
ncbi:conserved hypothetical protein [Burkholderia pseudomallei Pakistan 9]|uniref:Uncharacterized protein n=1 Tax=Burkholderia pseudomallei 1710a TaxID=320371 RepID=A0A0E1W288_BURPE|nr:hypothetical protein BURPS668_3637 [Burkholderia pseudomallei 668]EEH25824.1 conserved hypothetical protein [Burkholderia pseudomallei Pakistan 9]EET06534.1 hypothetical protein BURPS1710A_4158 [Burkholderia pseudomallei 1710a]